MTSPTATTLHELMTYVETGEGDWEEAGPGHRYQTLFSDPDTGRRILMAQWDAGFELPFHDEHRHDEFLYIVSGTFVDQHRSSGPGTFIHNEPGSWHQPSTPGGCTFLAVISPRMEQ